MSQLSLPGLPSKKRPAKKLRSIKPGDVFNRITVVSQVGKNKYNHYVFQCVCQCGNTFEAIDNNLRSGNTQSCGCLNKELLKSKPSHSIDLEGRQFGKQKVIRENGRNPKGEIVWLLQCECGREFSRVGRFLLKTPEAKRCPCQNSKDNASSIKKRNVQKPRNNEQFALDIYNMYIKNGVSVRDAANEEGYKSATGIIKILMQHVPEYREASIKRRENSEWAKIMESSNKKSKIFRFEKDLQKECVLRLKSRGEEVVQENDKKTTGFEIDIKTEKRCHELKITTRKKDIYTAIGQLNINAAKTSLQPVLVIPSDTTIAQSVMNMLDDSGIVVLTEKTV